MPRSLNSILPPISRDIENPAWSSEISRTLALVLMGRREINKLILHEEDRANPNALVASRILELARHYKIKPTDPKLMYKLLDRLKAEDDHPEIQEFANELMKLLDEYVLYPERIQEYRSQAALPIFNKNPVILIDTYERTVLFSNPASNKVLSDLKIGEKLPDVLHHALRQYKIGGDNSVTIQGRTFAIKIGSTLDMKGQTGIFLTDITDIQETLHNKEDEVHELTIDAEEMKRQISIFQNNPAPVIQISGLNERVLRYNKVAKALMPDLEVIGEIPELIGSPEKMEGKEVTVGGRIFVIKTAEEVDLNVINIYFNDITETKFWAFFAENNPDPVFMAMADGKIRKFNASAGKTITGLEEGAVMPKSLKSVIGAPYQFTSCQLTEKEVEYNGRSYLLKARYAPELAPGSNLILFYLQDITESLLKDQEIAEQHQNLASFVRQMIDRMEAPLNLIASRFMLWRENLNRSLSEDGKNDLDRVQKECGALDDLMKQLSEFIEDDDRAVSTELVETDDVMQKLASEFNRNPGIDVKIIGEVKGLEREEEPLPPIKSDPILIKQIFRELIDNAVKYNKNPTKKVRISYVSFEDGEAYNFIVADNGTGISSDNLEKIFRPLEQLDIGTTANKGSGLGLSAVKNMITKLGGSIQVESKVGQGSKFIVRIPIVI